MSIYAVQSRVIIFNLMDGRDFVLFVAEQLTKKNVVSLEETFGLSANCR